MKGYTSDLSPLLVLMKIFKESSQGGPYSCLAFTSPLRCGQIGSDQTTLATDLRGLAQGSYSFCGLRCGTKKRRARESIPSPVDASLHLFSSELSLAGSGGMRKEVPACWRLPFLQRRFEHLIFVFMKSNSFATLIF